MKLAEMKEVIEKDINDDLENIRYFKMIRAVLEKFEGQKVSERMGAAIQNALTGFTTYYQKTCSWYEIVIWEKNHKDSKRFTLAYDSSPIFSIDFFDKTNASYGSAAEKRIEKNKKFLENPTKTRKLAGAINSMNEAYTIINDEFNSNKFPACFDVLEKFHNGWRKR